MTDLDFSNYEQEPPQKPQNNKTFMIIVGVLGAVILLALVAAAVYAMMILPGQNAAKQSLAIQVNAQNTATVMAATSSAMTAMAPTETPEPTATLEPTSTPEPTATPEPKSVDVESETTIVAAADGTPLDENQAMTATVAALLTQASGIKPDDGATTATVDPAAFDAAATATALPTTGFADEVGIPSMVGLGLLCIVAIIVTRQARLARSR
jgi:cytoskeletal protein RodZ